MFSKELISKQSEKETNYPYSESDEEEDDAKYLTQLIQKTYHAAIIELYKEVLNDPSANVVLKKVIDLRAREMLEHIGATLPDELLSDTVFTTPRTEHMTEPNANTQRSLKGDSDNSYLKEINANMLGPKITTEQAVSSKAVKEKKLQNPTVNTDSPGDSSKLGSYFQCSDKRRAPLQNAPSDKENLKYF